MTKYLHAHQVQKSDQTTRNYNTGHDKITFSALLGFMLQIYGYKNPTQSIYKFWAVHQQQ